MIKVAVLIDGGFFLKRYHSLRYTYSNPDLDPKKIAAHVLELALFHTERNKNIGTGKSYLYRTFFYDCPPHEKRHHNPMSGKAVDFSKSSQAKFTNELHSELKKTRKVALRLGTLVDEGWSFKKDIKEGLMKGTIHLKDLNENNIFLQFRQKQVDMKIGIDIASLAYKKQVDQIILVSGDRDFVPAAKLARREGIDFILDTMGLNVNESLFDNIDGLQTAPKHKQRNVIVLEKAANEP